jgi:hypothetical protein
MPTLKCTRLHIPVLDASKLGECSQDTEKPQRLIP